MDKIGNSRTKYDEKYEKLGGYLLFGRKTHLVHGTKWGGGGGSSHIFPKSHLVIMVSIWRPKGLQTPLPTKAGYMKFILIFNIN